MSPEHIRESLKKYLPSDAVEDCVEWIVKHRISVRIKRTRMTKYGDYHPPLRGQNHKITINHDLNEYAFLITFTHEVAHLNCFNRYGISVSPHGEEWKREFKFLLIPLMHRNIFPHDIKSALVNYIRDPSASSCSDLNLQKTLSRYDMKKDGWLHLEDLNEGQAFTTVTGKVFVKGRKLRKNYECYESATQHKYFIYPLLEVLPF